LRRRTEEAGGVGVRPPLRHGPLGLPTRADHIALCAPSSTGHTTAGRLGNALDALDEAATGAVDEGGNMDEAVWRLLEATGHEDAAEGGNYSEGSEDSVDLDGRREW